MANARLILNLQLYIYIYIFSLHTSPEVQKSLNPMHSGGGWDSQGWSSSMTSSMQLAKECLKDPPEASEEPPAPLEGLEMFAQTIETGESKLCVSSLCKQGTVCIHQKFSDKISGNISRIKKPH